MFTQNHFIWLAVCAAAIIVALIAACRTKLSERKAAYIMSGICIVSEVGKIMSEMTDSPFGGGVLDPCAMPFHLCSMMIFAVFYIALSKNGQRRQVVLSFLAPVGLIGGICAMLIPTNGVSFAEFPAYQCFVYHAAIVWYALYSIIAKHVKIGRREYFRNVGILSALAFLMIYVNSALSAYGTNFMYVVRPPMENLPLLNLDNGWYAYFFTLLALGAVIMTLVHIPFIVAESREEREKKEEQNMT